MATLHPANLSVPFFPTAFADFVTLCHIQVIPSLLQTFSVLFYVLQWSVILDVTAATCRWWVVFFSNKLFLIKVCIFFRHNAITHFNRLQHYLTIILYILGNQKIHMTCFLAIFALLGWSGSEPAVPLRLVCVYPFEQSSSWCSCSPPLCHTLPHTTLHLVPKVLLSPWPLACPSFFQASLP